MLGNAKITFNKAGNTHQLVNNIFLNKIVAEIKNGNDTANEIQKKKQKSHPPNALAML